MKEKRRKFQTDVANMDLRVVSLLALLGNIMVWQFRVNNVKVSGQIFHLVENLTGILWMYPYLSQNFTDLISTIAGNPTTLLWFAKSFAILKMNL